MPAETTRPASNAPAFMPALLQALMFTVGMGAGAVDAEVSDGFVGVLALGLYIIVLLTFLEVSIHPRCAASVGLSPDHYAMVAAVTGIGAGLLLLAYPTHLCFIVVSWPPWAVAFGQVLAAVGVGSRLLGEGRARRHWREFTVGHAHDGVALLQPRSGSAVLAHVGDHDVRPGAAFMLVESRDATYRESGVVVRVRGYESQQARKVRRALLQECALRLLSALMWVAVALAPVFGAALCESG